MRKLVFCLLAFSAVVLFAVSCNVTRTVTTSAESYTKGDTTVTIITKTTESYDASKKQ